MKKLAKMAVAAAIAGFGLAASAGIVIDDFEVEQGLSGTTKLLSDVTSNGTGYYNSATGATTSIIGGERDIFIERLGGGGSASTVSTFVDGGTFYYSTDAGAFGTAYIKWDGENGSSTVTEGSQAAFLGTLDATGLGGVDLLASGSAFLINVYNSDLGFNFALSVYTSATEWTTLVLAATAHLNGIPAPSPIEFADFFGVAGENGTVLPSMALRFTGVDGSADMTNVGALLAQINFSGATGKVDMEILDARTVPEPASLALVGLALLGLGAARRRKSVK